MNDKKKINKVIIVGLVSAILILGIILLFIMLSK